MWCLNFLPDSLTFLLEGILVRQDFGLKLASIGQVIMQAARPRVLLAPLQVKPQNLPPTSAAATYHSLHVYFQVQQWKGVDETISTEEWGWKSCEGLLVPVVTHLPPAPKALLHVIRCNCSTDCSSLRCSCRKNNLECSPACGQCRGSACNQMNLKAVVKMEMIHGLPVFC